MIITNSAFKNDLQDVLDIFGYPERVEVVHYLDGGVLNAAILFEDKRFSQSFQLGFFTDKLLEKRLIKRHLKLFLYNILKDALGFGSPWGSLTGIRPVKFYSDLVKEDGEEAAIEKLTGFYGLSVDKAKLLRTIHGVQKKPLSEKCRSALYISIPFCKSRCSYCSFYSADVEKSGNLLDDYTGCLLKEIDAVSDRCFDVIYVGGGTPSSIPLNNIKKIAAKLSEFKAKEFTFEAGRPDSISDELLAVLKNNGVTRISVNSQTSNDSTLLKVGRKHTFADCLKAFSLSKKYGFNINMDLIHGLPEESEADFLKSVTDILKLKPENITIHTLSLKRGSSLYELNRGSGQRASANENTAALQSAYDLLATEGYQPYYLYRLKKTAGNLENTGFSLSGKECLYNIYNMDDTVDIIACGADGISKITGANGRIDRYANLRDVKLYIEKMKRG